jgi:hypothetical protein
VLEVRLGQGLLFLIPLILTVVFWRRLVWGHKLRDLFVLVGAIVISAVIHYAAFIVRPR